MGSDFNGDGRDDILWINADGVISNWLGRNDGGFTINDANALTNTDGPGGWEVLGSGDFNGDGRDDVLWITDGFAISNWLGTDSGGFVINDANALVESNGCYFAGTGDFNGDGYDDVLWWDYYNSILTSSGTASGALVQNAPISITASPSDWFPVGVGDFNGDGLDDVLWRNVATGALTDWLSVTGGGFAVNDANAFHDVPTNWFVVGVGDFNGDGRDDILWRNSVGTLSNWLGTGTGGFVINDTNAMSHVPLNWAVVGNRRL